LMLVWVLTALACSGKLSSSGTGPVTPAMNVASAVVDAGPTTTASAFNTLFTTVTICVPGSTTECQSIDHVQVDTGSYGLRVLGSVLSLALPTTKATDGNSLAECTVFVDGYSWGPVASADIQVAGETAASVPIQIIGAANFAAVPNSCSSMNGNPEDTVAAFGANGILGVGVFAQDCGPACANAATAGNYYSCSQTVCVSIAAPLISQVPNPVALFATDNNGVIIQLPTVVSQGVSSLTGSLIFGIDTQTNNASGNQTVLSVNGQGYFATTLAGLTYDASFIDSGTNGLYFNDASIVQCTASGFAGFYCPASTVSLSATLTGQNDHSTNVTISVDNAQTVFTANPTFTAFPTVAGTFPGTTSTFDFGLPFFYGRRVAFAIETHTTAVGTGPYVAF